MNRKSTAKVVTEITDCYVSIFYGDCLCSYYKVKLSHLEFCIMGKFLFINLFFQVYPYSINNFLSNNF